MDKEYYQQLELFSQAKDRGERKTPGQHQFFSYIRLWERTLLVIIGLVITEIISFSLGVEKGKTISRLKTDSRLDIALKIQKTKTPAKPQAQPVDKEALQEYLPSYTIQVASFLNRTTAQKEEDTL